MQAPKPKSKKKTKQQLEEEKQQAEEAARLAEEERLRLEEEEKGRKAAEAATRQAFIAGQTEREDVRLAEERHMLKPILDAHQKRLAADPKVQEQVDEWERFLSCSPLPDVRDPPGLHAYFAEVSARSHQNIKDVLHTCQEYGDLITQARYVMMDERMHETASSLRLKQLVIDCGLYIDRVLDAKTALALQNIEGYPVGPHGVVQLSAQTACFKVGLWINTTKSPRQKTADFPNLGISIDVPKPLLLAPVAIRALWRESDHRDHLAVSGVLFLDVLAMPSPAVNIKGWTLRQAVADQEVIHKLTYPTPPAGGDLATWVPEANTPPFRVTFTLPPGSILQGTDCVAARYSLETHSWVTEGYGPVSHDLSSGSVSFQSSTNGILAVLQKRTLLPYKEWCVRPTGGQYGGQAMVHVQTGMAGIAFAFMVDKNGVQLVEPGWPHLEGIRGRTMTPSGILFELIQKGLYLVPDPSDVESAGLVMKETAVVKAMCTDVACLGITHLIKGSRWNRHVSSHECLCRISQVVDWEDGGRTSKQHTDRIFNREHSSGPNRVITIIRRGVKGIAYTDALDGKHSYPRLPEYGDAEYDSSAFGRLHASALILVATAAPDAHPDIPPEGEPETAAADASQTPADSSVLVIAPEVNLERAKDYETLFMRNLSELLSSLGVFNS